MENQDSSTYNDGSQGDGSQGNGTQGEFGLSSAPSAHIGAGQLIREAREKAGIPASKVSADLRIAPATLEALEAGEYGRLAGPPYVRAMLVSLSRYLRLDSRNVLKAYADEAGGLDAATQTVSPYKDDSGTHAKAHKQIFILVLAVLLFILLLIMGKVNTASPDLEPAGPPAVADTLLNLEPPMDSTFTDSLADSLLVNDSLPAAAAIAPVDSLSSEEPDTETRVRLIALSDSIWLRVLPAGERESSRYLRIDQPVDYSHDDAITFITRKGGTVRVIAGNDDRVAPGRRFKVDGTQISD